jgi:hypothetical protein
MDLERLLIGVAGAFVGVVGWLLVGIYIQRRGHAQQAKSAGRAVYFELGANHLTIFMTLEYGVGGSLGRATYDRLLPELATWLPPAELQAVALAYLGQSGYAQVTEDQTLSMAVRRASLRALADAHDTALRLIRDRVFTTREIRSLDTYAGEQHRQLMKASRLLEERVMSA